MHLCKFNGKYLACSPKNRCYPEAEMKRCEGYEPSGDEIDPDFCKHSFDIDGWCTDECQCKEVRAKAREEWRSND